jgi:hypothetical protein
MWHDVEAEENDVDEPAGMTVPEVPQCRVTRFNDDGVLGPSALSSRFSLRQCEFLGCGWCQLPKSRLLPFRQESLDVREPAAAFTLSRTLLHLAAPAVLSTFRSLHLLTL